MSTFGRATQSRSVIGKKNLKTCPRHRPCRRRASRRRPQVPRRRAGGAGTGGGERVGHGAGGTGRARGATAGPQGHLRPPGAGDDDGEETGARPPVESRSISPGAAWLKAAEDFEGRKKNLSSDYHIYPDIYGSLLYRIYSLPNIS
jgi:hypothetical protein